MLKSHFFELTSYQKISSFLLIHTFCFEMYSRCAIHHTQGCREADWARGLGAKWVLRAESAGKFSGPRPFPLDHTLKFTGKTLLLDAIALLRLSLERLARGPRNVP